MVRWTIWDEMRRIQNEMDRMFSNLFSREPFRPTELLEGPRYGDLIARNLREPLSDVWEDEKEITVNMEIPGVEKEDIIITAKDRGLEVKVQRKDEYKEEDRKKGYYRLERKYAGFYRHFSLPENADVENIDANYENGILQLRIPKKKVKEKKKRIEVK